jgi:gas vesicle protein
MTARLNQTKGEEMAMNTKKSTTVAFVIGTVAGGVTALLLAPQSGAQLRRRIRNGPGELRAARARLNQRLKQAAGEKARAVAGLTEAKGAYKDELERRRHVDSADSVARKTGA